MGYYSTFNLAIAPMANPSEQLDGFDEEAQKIIGEFREESEGANYAIDEEGNCNESCKWYDHHQDLKKFSTKHPDKLFILSGEGEESGDIWTEYHNNGKVQVAKAKIIVEDFDPEKLI